MTASRAARTATSPGLATRCTVTGAQATIAKAVTNTTVFAAKTRHSSETLSHGRRGPCCVEGPRAPVRVLQERSPIAVGSSALSRRTSRSKSPYSHAPFLANVTARAV